MNNAFYKEFLVLAEVKNFWEASERLYLNQSTLSKHIRLMETELGVPLFSRTTRHVELTTYGKTLIPYAQTIIKAESQYSARFMQIQNSEKGVLTLGTIPAMAQYGITSLLSAFQKQYPENPVKITEDDPKNLFSLLSDRTCQLVFTRETQTSFEKNLLENTAIVRIPCIRDHLVALLPKNHPLASAKTLALGQLKDERFCMVKEDSLMYDICVSACQAADFMPEIAFTSHRLDSIINMVCAGSHVGLLMNRHLLPPEKDLVSPKQPWTLADITPYIYSQVSLCYLKEQRLSASAQNFVNLCRQMYVHDS